MTNRVDHWGEVYGELTLIEYVKGGKYKCKCSCGEYKISTVSDMKKGKVKSCGHLKKERQLDIVGCTFNRLIVLDRVSQNDRGDFLFLCRCDCGIEKVLVGKEVKSGKIKSCGNHHVEYIKKRNTKHKGTGTRLYETFLNMKYRCNNPNSEAYKNYGGRGIKLCVEWDKEDGFKKFKEWAYSNGYDDSLTIDRIDVNGDYSPENCKWSTNTEQNRNKRNTIFVTIHNETKTLIDWCEFYDINYGSVWRRINKYNYTPEKALTYKTERLSKFNT